MLDIEKVLRQTKDNEASDLHLTVGVPPIMRVNGELTTLDYPKLMPNDTEEILKRLISPYAREQFEKHGECDFSISVPNCGRYRVNAFRQRGSIAMAMRMVKTEIPSAEKLGIPNTVMDLYRLKRGLVLVTGPTGSGKSTTLAALIDKINRNKNVHIITLEDPIEFLHHHEMSVVNQREIGMDSMDFAHALRAALREDPDVILVGEMRDLETISVAITAAETGHLVFSTLHTNSAANTIDRIIDVFPPHQQQQVRIQLANVLSAVISQQLIPASRGRDRAAAFEVLLVNNAARNLIRECKTHQIPNVIQTNRRAGMITMDDAITQLYYAGRISRESALLFAQEPENMSL